MRISNVFVFDILRAHVLQQSSIQNCDVTVGHVFLHLQRAAVTPELNVMMGTVFLHLRIFDGPPCFFDL